MKLRTCVSPEGKFVYGIHNPSYTVINLREGDYIASLGRFDDGREFENRVNFPVEDIEAPSAGMVYEIPNPFPFRGTTYINKVWAERNARDPLLIRLPEPPEVSFADAVSSWAGKAGVSSEDTGRLLGLLPESLQLALAETGTDPDDLVGLADLSCDFLHDRHTGRPVGLRYEKDRDGRPRPAIRKPVLFEVLANNPYLPDDYKIAMVLKPGVQGDSPITGEWSDPDAGSHVFEYLRTNSYIPWGHYAANMADDSIRYSLAGLSLEDMYGMRHLYYQRTYVRMAESLGIPVSVRRRTMTAAELESLRQKMVSLLGDERRSRSLKFDRTLWGWNYGVDFAPSRYRLHASHQQVHQQFALIPKHVNSGGAAEEEIPAYGSGDPIEAFASQYREETGTSFFEAYIRAIENNVRLSGSRPGGNGLVIHDDGRVMVFVPKAQTSQWELQLMTKAPVGNIIEADLETRRSIDRAMLTAVKALGALGVRMLTTIEYPKRISSPDTDQRLIYSFLPRLPESPGAFSEAQLRWINGHYPEDFAEACKNALTE